MTEEKKRKRKKKFETSLTIRISQSQFDRLKASKWHLKKDVNAMVREAIDKYLAEEIGKVQMREKEKEQKEILKSIESAKSEEKKGKA